MNFDSKNIDPKVDLAKIVKIEENYIFVKVAVGGCKNCALSGICKLEERVQKFKVDDISNYKVGDFVEIVVKSGSRIFSAFMIFIFPLIFMIGAYFVSCDIFHFSEKLCVLFSLVGLMIGGIILRLSDKKLAKKITFEIKKWSGKNENPFK